MRPVLMGIVDHKGAWRHGWGMGVAHGGCWVSHERNEQKEQSFKFLGVDADDRRQGAAPARGHINEVAGVHRGALPASSVRD